MGLTTRMHSGMSCIRTGSASGRPGIGCPVRFRGR